MMSYGVTDIRDWSNIASDNGFVPNGTKPLAVYQLMLTIC